MKMTTQQVQEAVENICRIIPGISLGVWHVIYTPIGQLQPQAVIEYNNELKNLLPNITPVVNDMHSLMQNIDFRQHGLSITCLGLIAMIHSILEHHADFQTGYIANPKSTSIQAQLPSYKLLWLIRNAASHDFNLNIDNKNNIPKVLPCTWTDHNKKIVTITKSDLGSPIPLTIAQMIMLMHDIKNELTNVP